MNPVVENYRLLAANGNPIRIATKVVFPGGYEIRFIEKMGKKEAIRQAKNLLALRKVVA